MLKSENREVAAFLSELGENKVEERQGYWKIILPDGKPVYVYPRKRLPYIEVRLENPSQVFLKNRKRENFYFLSSEEEAREMARFILGKKEEIVLDSERFISPERKVAAILFKRIKEGEISISQVTSQLIREIFPTDAEEIEDLEEFSILLRKIFEVRERRRS